MKITESNLKKILNEEIHRILDMEENPRTEAILEALDTLAGANPSSLKEELPILEELIKRIKSS